VENKKMKKTLIASAVLFSGLVSLNTNAASITVTNMYFPGFGSYSATGTLEEFGGGGITGIQPFLGRSSSAVQQTMFMDNTGSWSGDTGSSGTANDIFNYDDEIMAMGNQQIAVGLYWDWNNNDTAILAIFDCFSTVEGGIVSCTGADPVLMDNGPFNGALAVAVNSVPVPAAAWLMGSGLLGLVGLARRHRSR
jgi:hypothetical protein